MTDGQTRTDRTNEQWLADLRADGETQANAIEDLQRHVRRSILYYLSQDRSDLRSLAYREIERMADDLAQDATLRVIASKDMFRGESKFTTWASRIAVRLAISDLRRARHKDFSLENITADGELFPTNTDLSSGLNDNPPGPETSTERRDVLHRIDAAMREALTERQYQVIQAVALRGVPMDVVAEQMDTNRNALYKLMHDARRKLRAHLEEQGLSMDYMMELFGR
ncbi:MAG: RNA polymerase sigma factor [Anaerolineaceae bacterium]|nr:MAG: RNA polymerase sigma factor [Anaerolineaceae bacterium]